MNQNELNKNMTENELHNVSVNVWNFYNEEILFLFRSLKYILTAAENQSSHYSVSINAHIKNYSRFFLISLLK